MPEEIYYDPTEDTDQSPAEDENPVLDISDITQKTIFLQVRYGSIGNTRKVPGSQVLDTEADVSFLRVSKTLLESDELEAIRHHDSALRKYLGNVCLPYSQLVGVLILPYAFVPQVKAKLQQHRDERLVLVDRFVAVYPELKVKAQESLKDLYQDTDYPNIAELREKFKFGWAMMSFSTPAHLKAIDPELYEAELEKDRERIKIVTEEITQVMRGTLLEMVEHLQDKLTPGTDGKPKVLRESAVTKLNEFLNNFDMRNVTNDDALALEVQKVKALLGGTTAQALRTSDEWREKIRKGMANVTESLGGLVENQTERRFKQLDTSTEVVATV